MYEGAEGSYRIDEYVEFRAHRPALDRGPSRFDCSVLNVNPDLLQFGAATIVRRDK